jgi:hypothetical protein
MPKHEAEKHQEKAAAHQEKVADHHEEKAADNSTAKGNSEVWLIFNRKGPTTIVGRFNEY